MGEGRGIYIYIYIQDVPKMWEHRLTGNSSSNLSNISLYKNFRYNFVNEVTTLLTKNIGHIDHETRRLFVQRLGSVGYVPRSEQVHKTIRVEQSLLNVTFFFFNRKKLYRIISSSRPIMNKSSLSFTRKKKKIV